MIVDSQVHIWAADTPERPWPPGEAARAHQPTPLTAERLLEKMDAAGVARAILVPPSWEGDRNDVVLAAAQRYPDRFAVMGRISLEAPESRARIPAADAHRGHARSAVHLPYGRSSRSS